MTQLDQFLERAEALLTRIEAFLPHAVRDVDWNASNAFRWRKPGGKGSRGYLQPVTHMARIAFSDLHNIEPQKQQIEQAVPPTTCC